MILNHIPQKNVMYTSDLLGPLQRSQCWCVHAHPSLNHGQLFATPWTVAHQAPLSMGFSRQGYWSGCHFPLQGIFPTQGLNPCLLHLLHWQAGALPPGHLGNPLKVDGRYQISGAPNSWQLSYLPAFLHQLSRTPHASD